MAEPAHQQADISKLPDYLQSDTQITSHLASRFHISLPTATISSHALISFNSYTSSTRGPNGGREGSAAAGCEELAHRMWVRLGARGENQAAVFLGESGSGKTTLRSHLLSSILAYTSTPLSVKLSLATFIFDTLTTTKTTTTPIASKAGLFYELQYDTSSSASPTLIGGKILDHRLERSRVAGVPTGERSFHVLYYLLAGTSAAEKAHLGLDNAASPSSNPLEKRSSLTNAPKRWRYLGHPTQMKVGINDAEGFQQFKTALRQLEFPSSEIAQICQILACILHIGQLEFATAQQTTTMNDESGGYSHEGGETVTTVKNKDVLGIVAAFLGVSVQELDYTLANKTKILHRERVTVMLDPKGARANADELARMLYSLVVAFILETVNQKICAAEDLVSNTISIVDFPGFALNSSTGSTLDQLLNNAATEALYNFCLQSFFERSAELLESEEVAVQATTYFDNSDAVKGLLKPGNGLLSILDDQARRGKTDTQLLESLAKRFQNKNPAISVGSSTTTLPGSNFATTNLAASFVVRHFAGEVDYPVAGLTEENGESVSGDMIRLVNSTSSDFVRELFGQEVLQTVSHPKEKSTIMQAQISSKPLRKPSVMRRKGGGASRFGGRRNVPEDDGSENGSEATHDEKKGRGGDTGRFDQGAAGQFVSSLDVVTRSLSAPSINPYFIFCLKPNDRRIANHFDSKCVRTQIQTFGIAEISQRLRCADFSVFLPLGEFLGMVDSGSTILGGERDKADHILQEKNWPENEARLGSTGVFLSERCWYSIANVGARPLLRDATKDKGFLTPAYSNVFSDSKEVTPVGPFDDKAGYFGDPPSEAGGSAMNSGDMFKNLETREQMAEKGNQKKMQEVDELPVSGGRKRWMFLVYLLTFWIPDFLIRLVGRMKRKDIRTAWREKLAINMLIWLSCGFVTFFIVVFPNLICPRQNVYSAAELSSYDGKGSNQAFASIRGIVIDLGAFSTRHYPSIVPAKDLRKYAGLDVTGLFPVQVSALCQGVDGNIDQSVQPDYKPTNVSGQPTLISNVDPNTRYHDFRAFTNDSRPDWFFEQMVQLKGQYMKGYIGYTPQYVHTLSNKQQSIAILRDRVYDLTAYVAGGRQILVGAGQDVPSDVNTNFMNDLVVQLFQASSGQDITKYWDALPIDGAMRKRMQLCLDNLFFVGKVDTRSSPQCLFARYILLAISILLVSVIGFKFFAALQFGKKNLPENLDRFVICQVPAYTEDEDSLRRAIDSIARMRYDDKRKLLVVVCDGMIIGQGNDRPTPRIVLDILGVPETVDPEPLSFESLGEGMKQHNMGKVYSGLYEVQGHIVPFLVIVKVGKPSETSRPGNRGKRDSQLILMRFLKRVHYNEAMSPLELEMYHQIRNIIGVNPMFYEFMLQVDADTVVAQDSATRMVAAFLHDTRLIGICGETALTNAKSSFITMIQVYEYYISHNLSKAFESLFGSVTCLPGCFSMYRIRSDESTKPLFVSKEVVKSYAEIRVDTLHMKNLLHLGEDRYLTTLLLKHHPKYKTRYIFAAHAWTIAPDSWKVFMSQRRRWINSTLHNLMELIPMQQLCGFCCFSMRFVVFLDLLSTIVQPVTVGYIGYLIYLLIRQSNIVPITAFILLGAIYGLQAIIFILRRKWEMIGWMILYILAIPVFSFALPLYAFWNMDDFTWGNTRVVTGEKGQKIIISDEGKFDPESIPKKKWEDYQNELWDAQSQRDEDGHSEFSGYSYATKSFVGGGIGAGVIPPMPMPHSDYGGGYFSNNKSGSTMDLLATTRQPSRLSLASDMPGSQRGNNNSPSGFYGGGQDLEMSQLTSPGTPSDDAILAEIRDILRTADLMTVTKKMVKQELERRFGVPLDTKRSYINSATEALLAGQL